MENLLRLVDDIAVLESAWERRPFVSTPRGGFDAVFTVAAAERLLFAGLPLASARLFRDGRPLPSGLIARSGGSGARVRDRQVDGAKVIRHVGDGATLTLEDLQSHSPRIAAFAAALFRETGYEADCTAFLTPPHSRGVDPHYDPVSVFLRQVHGAKRWRISAPAVRWPGRRTGFDAAAVAAAGEPVLDVVLREGQCLYIPRGFVHVGETAGEPSVHLSVSLRAATWGSVLGVLLAAAAEESEELRESLPPRFATADTRQLFQDRLNLFAKHLAALRWDDAPLARLRAEADQPVHRPGALSEALAGR